MGGGPRSDAARRSALVVALARKQLLGRVARAVMPQGVQHPARPAIPASDVRVARAVMPQGVQHSAL